MYYSIEKIIQDWCNECYCTAMTIPHYDSRTVDIITVRPGIMIGYKGKTITKYKEKINELGWDIHIVEANEIHRPGDDWEQIIDERVEGYFEMEDYH